MHDIPDMSITLCLNLFLTTLLLLLLGRTLLRTLTQGHISALLPSKPALVLRNAEQQP